MRYVNRFCFVHGRSNNFLCSCALNFLHKDSRTIELLFVNEKRNKKNKKNHVTDCDKGPIKREQGETKKEQTILRYLPDRTPTRSNTKAADLPDCSNLIYAE